MRLSMMVQPFTGENLALAAQVGVSDIVAMYPGRGPGALAALKAQVEASGMRLSHIERKLPHLKIVHRLPGWEAELEDILALVRNMGESGLEVLCYNWMPDEDWQRTGREFPERGGALVTGFDLGDAVRGGENVTDADGRPQLATPAETLWENLRLFLAEVVPAAEEAGVKLALHPDDPPLRNLNGQDRIITDTGALERAVALVPSPSNGVCFCTGSLGVFGQESVLEGIERLAPHIHFAHVRNVRGTPERFVETWHDNGQLDLGEVVRTFVDRGFRGAIRPDHAPSMAGETNDHPGYEMKGRLFAAGYLRGLMDAAGA